MNNADQRAELALIKLLLDVNAELRNEIRDNEKLIKMLEQFEPAEHWNRRNYIT